MARRESQAGQAPPPSPIPPGAAPRITVVVFVREHRSGCLRALDALERQPGRDAVEVIVVEGSGEPSTDWLGSHGCRVRHLVLPPVPMPLLKAAGIRAARGPLIAVLDPLDVPEPTWLAAIEQGFRDAPGAAAIGGTVICAGSTSMANRAGYLFEYGAFAPPLAGGVTQADLPGNNVVYRREALLEWCADLLDQGFWKPFFHARIRQRGGHLVLNPGQIVRHETDHRFWSFALRRGHYGRCFGAMRIRESTRGRRLLYRVLGPAVPVLLILRHTRNALRRPGNRERLLRCWPALWGICLSWGAGECLGYWFGAGGSCQRVY